MSIEELKKQLTNTRANITRIKNIVEDGARILTTIELKCRLGILESYFVQALSYQTEIEKIDSTDSGRAQIEDIYIETKLAIQSRLGDDANNTTNMDSTLPILASTRKLPNLKLPTFSGKYAEYKNFISSFTQIIDRELYLSNIEKFNHLLNCLQGQALETVKAFPVTNENYPKALKRLADRYDNNTLIFLENVTAIFDLPTITRKNCRQLRSIVDNVTALYGSLQSLGTHQQIADALIIYMVMKKVDEETQKKWKESLQFQLIPSWEDCRMLLKRHCQFLESLEGSSIQNDHRIFDKTNKGKQTPQNRNFAFSITKHSCIFCSSSDHFISSCARFKEKNVCGRFEFVKLKGLCINCLSNKHRCAQCPSQFKCKICSKAHHTLLHKGSNESVSNANLLSLQEQSPSSTTVQIAASHSHRDKSSPDQVLLATAIVLVRDSSGTYQMGRALLDSCSQVNFITNEFAQRLRLTKNKRTIEVLGIGDSQTKIKQITNTSIKSRFAELELPLSFCVTTHISYQPDSEIDVSSWNVPANIQLADEQFFKSNKIDLLMGTETFFGILSVGQVKLGEGLPVLQKTLLGWIVSGRYQPRISNIPKTCLLTVEESINENLQLLWKLDEPETKMETWSDEQQFCESHFLTNVFSDKSGRLIVKLPFMHPVENLGLSEINCRQRFLSQEQRLRRNEEYKNQYIAFMREYADLGHMSLVINPNTSEPHFYIPHHFVLKPSSTSTKFRVVFDASCKTTTGKSLNDILGVGPKLQQDLFDLLLRFRLFRFALTADIEKMYRQVVIHPDQRKFQYIFWRESDQEELRTYQLNTVTYGTASAPHLAVRSLHYLAEQYASEFELASNLIKSHFYVDDFLCGADDIHQLEKIKHDVSTVLQRGGFRLTKWHSNHEKFRDDDSVKYLSSGNEVTTSALGISWNQYSDTFKFSFGYKLQSSVNKRSILSIASMLFDPLGILSPLIVTAKIILQELWILKINWDESVPQDIHSAWIKFLEGMKSLSNINVPRYCLTPNQVRFQLHGFADASIRAYGCCIYIRTLNEMKNACINLLTAKSRVAPTKKKSLSKLELCAAHLLANLVAKVLPSFNNFKIDIYLWSDSQIVLHWLTLHSSTLSTFVGNRISDIQELTSMCNWRHVPSQQNPADLVSRGCNSTELNKSIWFTGPAFLYKTQENWPINSCNNFDIEEVNREKRKSAFNLTTKANYILDCLNNISSHIKAVRTMAYILRFCNSPAKHHKNNLTTNVLSPAELENALWCIVYIIQRQYFASDINYVKKNQQLQGSLKCLNPFVEQNGKYELLKVGGRLEQSKLPYNQRHPILLPSNCPFVEHFVQYLHISNYHAGSKILISLIRNRFWIINARRITRRIVNSCLHCVRYKPKLMRQIMGNLPTERLEQQRPFSRCAVDFCGPVLTYLRLRGKLPYKTYICIFVCMASKAVHIECVTDLSTNAFIAALKRLCGRRGAPSEIFCDNATNFAGACNKLAELKAFLFRQNNQDAIITYCANEFIQFRFIPPRAPHFGGLWEAAVKVAKGHLNRTFLNTRLTLEELNTALIEIEAILNSRPLTPLSTDPNDYEAITPAHLLIGSSLRGIPERKVPTDNLTLLEKWNRINAVKQHFWNLWHRDYLHELQIRTKWSHVEANAIDGSLVIIHEDNIPPQKWPMGRIVNTIPGKDNRIRVIDIKTAKGIIRRPVHKVAIIPT